jgi:hypothetical protein
MFSGIRLLASETLAFSLCAEHARQLEGESPFDNRGEVIAKRKGETTLAARRGLKEAWSKSASR